MDLFEFDFFRDWELEQQCHYEPDRNALKKKEWERRNQEVQQDEDLFSSGFNLFGEPYKTSKGDALANRVQNTLGNYDEMKELLTNHSNQSHLVGIPKSSTVQTPADKSESGDFFQEGARNRARSSQCTPIQPPTTSTSSSSCSSSASSSVVQGSKKWSRAGQQAQGSAPSGGRSKHGSSNHEDLYVGSAEVQKSGSSPVPSPSHSRQTGKAPPSDHTHKEGGHCGKSPAEVELASCSPVASTSLLPSGVSTPTFPQGLHCKSSLVQQKPTAYVRPMDGQDQAPSDSPELKPPPDVANSYTTPAYEALLEAKATSGNPKGKLPKLTLPPSGEVNLSSDSSCVEDILREMTHSWPPPLTAIHTPGKAEQTKFPIPSKDSQHLTSGYNGQKRCNIPTTKAATKAVPQKSMLEDDLKISSDEEDTEQVTDNAKPRATPPSLPGPAVQNSEPGHSSGASGSSSESESSSESDSDTESSSSDSECNRASRSATPEPEAPSTNKWQLDKWLNKVNSHNKALIHSQPENHRPGDSQPEDGRGEESTTMGKAKPAGPSVQLPDAKESTLLSPIREKAKGTRLSQKIQEGKPNRIKSPANLELAPPRRNMGKKQPKKMERVPSLEEQHSWPKPNNLVLPPKEKETPPPEQPKPRNKAPRKELRSTPMPTIVPSQDKKKHRGTNKIIPKSKEFIETESSSSECHSDQEELVKVTPPCRGPSSLGHLKSKECNSNILSVSSLTSNSSTSIPDPGVADMLEDPLFSPIPIVQNELLSPLRDLEEIKSLWVKIELSLLSRVPGQNHSQALPAKVKTRDCDERHRRQSASSIPAEKSLIKSKRKHKSENGIGTSVNKKLRLEIEATPLLPSISPMHSHKLNNSKELLKKPPRKRDEKLLPPLLSPLSDEPVHQHCPSGCNSFVQEPEVNIVNRSAGPAPSNCAVLSSSSSLCSSTSHKSRKGDGKSTTHSKTNSEEDTHSKPTSSFHGNGQPDPDLWSKPPSAQMDHLESRRPKLTFTDTLYNADYYMQQAKKLKHKADAQLEKFGKAINYADGALSFIECGNAMERDPLEAKSPYTMYSETVELIRYALRLKNFTSRSALLVEKKLAVLCYRCLSLLYLRMFKLKKDHAMKYSRSLMEYFKNSSKAQAPSPWGTNGKSTGTPSPMSPSPSPASSNTGPSGNSSGGQVAIPQRIHHMAASHVNITNNVLRSYEHWDTADKLARESQEFFQELDSLMEPLTQHSSMTDLVRYIRQGLHWLRLEAHLL